VLHTFKGRQFSRYTYTLSIDENSIYSSFNPVGADLTGLIEDWVCQTTVKPRVDEQRPNTVTMEMVCEANTDWTSVANTGRRQAADTNDRLPVQQVRAWSQH